MIVDFRRGSVWSRLDLWRARNKLVRFANERHDDGALLDRLIDLLYTDA